MNKRRIQVYADPELKRRIELAAAKENVAVTEYCLNAILQRLADDDILEQNQVMISIGQDPQDTLIRDLRDLHRRILAHRSGALVDVDGIVEQIRSERDEELLGLR